MELNKTLNRLIKDIEAEGIYNGAEALSRALSSEFFKKQIIKYLQEEEKITIEYLERQLEGLI